MDPNLGISPTNSVLAEVHVNPRSNINTETRSFSFSPILSEPSVCSLVTDDDPPRKISGMNSIDDPKKLSPVIDTSDRTLVSHTAAQHKKLMRKIDLHILPGPAVFYFLSFLDRVNLGNARLFNLEADLGMSGNDFNVALLVFFAPYIILELPSNLVLRKITPRIWLPCMSLSKCVNYQFSCLVGVSRRWRWGGHGIYVDCLCVECFSEYSKLGCFRGVFTSFPCGINGTKVSLKLQQLIIVQKRIALFYCSSALASSVGGYCFLGVS